MFQINWAALAVTVVGFMALGAFWYSPAFLGNIWMDAIKIDPADITKEGATKGIIISFITSIISVLTMAVLMNIFAITSGIQGLYFGLAIGAGIVGMTMLSNMAYEQENVFQVFFISGSYRIVSFLYAGWLLGFWR